MRSSPRYGRVPSRAVPDFAGVFERYENRKRVNTMPVKRAIAMETADARQPQPYVPYHRRVDRSSGCTRLQFVPNKERAGGPANQCRTERTENSEQVRRTALPMKKVPQILLLGSLAALALVPPAMANQVSREQDIVDLRLGQRVQVDDGSCPAGQIKEVSGAQMSEAGIVRARKCIPRLGTKKR
jgi:hypothetical protein